MDDETYVGGKPKNKHQQGKPRPGSNRGYSYTDDKSTVMALVNTETGEVRSRVIPDVTGDTLRDAIVEQVEPDISRLHTDARQGYREVGRKFLSHEWVDHQDREYVRGDVSTNAAENYFSQLKRSIDGTHHHVSKVLSIPRFDGHLH